MRIVLPLIVFTLATAAAPAPQPEMRVPMRELQTPPGSAARVCRDRLQQVRDERVLPRLDRDKAGPDEALLIAAVDKRIGGCSVMVVRNDINDIRPLPMLPDKPPSLQRIR